MICPKDSKPCCDDLCVSSCFETGEETLVRCKCGGWVTWSDRTDCTCEPEDDELCYYCGHPYCHERCEDAPGENQP